MLYKKSLTMPLAVFFIILFWASAYIGIRVGLSCYSPGAMALLRYLVASVCMFFIYAYTLKFRRIPWRDLLGTAVLGIFGFSIYNIGLNYGELTLSAGITSFVIGQMPVVLTLVGIIFFQDRLTKMGWIGTIISFFGILFIAVGKTHGLHFDIGIFYVFIATLSGAVYSILQKSLFKRMHPIEFTTFAIWFGTLGLMIYLPDLLQEIPKASYIATLSVVYNGIFPAAIGYLLWSYINDKWRTSQSASLLYVVPIVATLLGWLLLHETPNIIELGGGLLALLGCFIVKNNVRQAVSTPPLVLPAE